MSVLFVGAFLFGRAVPSAQALAIKACAPAVSSVPDSDLRVEIDHGAIAFLGRTNRVDRETLARELRRVVDKSGEINGRTVCLSLRTSPGNATYVGDSIPAAVGVLHELSPDAAFQALWGGGGLTVVGWMRRADVSLIKNLSSATFPVDVGAVGVIDDLPAKVRVRMERVSISASRVAQVEQFHPKAGVITLSTTSTVLLRACPGGWRGKTPSTAWKSSTCVEFDESTPALLPDPGNDYTHLSVAVRPVRGTASAIDLDLRYTAVDPSHQCYVGGHANRCTLLPPRLAT